MGEHLTNPVSKRDHKYGIKTAPLELLEYGDYQCPSCSESYLVIEEVIRQLGKNVMFIFINFPLIKVHPDAFDAALAAEAAALQNKFWEMYDSLYQNQCQLNGYWLFAYAKDIGLMTRFEQDIQSNALASKIEADIESGLKSGVNGAPTFYINGEKYLKDWENDGLIEDLKSVLIS